MKRLSILFGLVLVYSAALGQDNPPTGEIEDAQIIIEKDKPLTLPRATRKYQKSRLRPVSDDTISLIYNLSEPNIQLETKPYLPAIKGYEGFSVESGHQNYVKIGLGNYLSPLLQGYAGMNLSKKQALGVNVYHESFAKGPVRDEKSAYANSKIDVIGQFSGKTSIAYPTISFERESFYFYGYQEDVVPEFSDKIGLNHFEIRVPMAYASDDGLQLTFSPAIAATTMATSGTSLNKDVGADLDMQGEYELNDELEAYMGLGFRSWKYTSGYSSTRNVLSINPGIRFHNKQVNVKAGIEIALGKDDSTSATYLYPDVKLGYQITDELSLFANADGGLMATNLNSVRLQNRYLDDSLVFLNQNNKVRLKAGVTYSLKSDVSLEPFISYSYSAHQPLYYPGIDTSRFGLYNAEGLSTTSFGATLRWINKNSSLVAQLLMSSYDTKGVEEAWYLPTMELSVDYSQQIGDKLLVSVGLKALQGIQAPAPSDGTSEDLSTILDASLGAKYKIDKNWSGFMQVNNLLGIKYERYLNYPVRGFTAKFGVLYRF